jgi:patatin-like phospholipase/acyl hydrolase
LKSQYKIKQVGVIGHSVGGVGTLFSMAGYTHSIEENLLDICHHQIVCLMALGRSLKKKSKPEIITALTKQLDLNFDNIQKLIIRATKVSMSEEAKVSCYILLAPPMNCKKAIQLVKPLNLLPHNISKPIFEHFVHKPLVQQNEDRGNPLKYTENNLPDHAHWLCFKTENSRKFLEYFMNMEEPNDYLAIIEVLASLDRDSEQQQYFKEYVNNFLKGKPKLFIYGKKDYFLLPFIPFRNNLIQKFYKSFGNAKISYGSFGHEGVITSEDSIKQVLAFLKETMH